MYFYFFLKRSEQQLYWCCTRRWWRPPPFLVRCHPLINSIFFKFLSIIFNNKEIPPSSPAVTATVPPHMSPLHSPGTNLWPPHKPKRSSCSPGSSVICHRVTWGASTSIRPSHRHMEATVVRPSAVYKQAVFTWVYWKAAPRSHLLYI